jgi:hypothetical protein
LRHHDVYVRTTLTLDDDLAERLADLARQSRKPFKAVVNETLRRGLGESGPKLPPFVIEGHFGGLRPGIDDRSFNELMWESDEELERRVRPDSGA